MISTTLPLTWLPLAEAIAKTTLILAAAAVVSLTLRRASAALRHFVWTLAFCSALLIPLLTLALPKWQLPIVTVAAGPSSADLPDAAVSQRPAPPRTPRRELAPASSTLASVDAPPASLEPRTSSWLRGVSWPQALGTIWLLGMLACVGRMAVGFAAVRWLSRRTQVITDASWLPMARALARDLGVDGHLTFLRSGRAAMPVAAGIFRPSVIMPADADAWSPARLRIVLLHELAHVKRRDCLTHLIAQVACALYWFNPLAWMAAKRARTERERACDDLVLASGTRGTEYADQLLDIARAMRPDRLAGLLDGASLAMAHQSQLEGRLIAILDPGLPRAGVSRARGLAAIVLCCCAVAPLGALQPWGETNAANGSAVNTATAVNTANGSAASTANAVNAASGNAASTANAANADNGNAVNTANAVVVEIPESAAAQLATQPVPAPRPAPAPAALPETTEEDLASVVAGAVVDGVVGGTSDAVRSALQDTKPSARPEESRSKADPRTIAALTAALNDSDKEVRETAMHALVQLRDPSIFEPLLRALKDASPDVREQAAFGLGQMRDRRAVEPLVGALKDAQADVREQAAFALGQLREKSAVPALVEALKDAAPDVREQAAFALGHLRDPAAVDGLAVAVRDANADVREQAVFALSQIRDARSVGPLISALKDATPDVRQQAAFALGQLRDRTAVEPLIIAIKDANADVREQVAFALGQLRDPRAIDALTAALKDASADVRRQAAFALGQLAR
jgi:HEAT repeat protein/beta-lactamase regulating signal transducer with metallopeptidase domain